MSADDLIPERRDPRSLTPRAIVEELDRYIVGQQAAKRAVAVALRNRWRRQQVPAHLRDEIAPKNIIMIGPTGVGKTEIARRLAKLVQAPFIKVEASKFTEVGYVGRDVDSIVRDLVEIAVKLVKDEETAKVRKNARGAAEEKLLDLLLPQPSRPEPGKPIQLPSSMEEASSTTREKLREMLRAGKLDERMVEIEVTEQQNQAVQIFSQAGLEEMGLNLKELFGRSQKARRKVRVQEAMELLVQEEAGKLVDMDKVVREAVHRAENSGIVFVDEIDKIAGKESAGGPDVSRQGVQRDLLPIVEGSTVTTKYGPVRTDHVLFIAAGAFHVSKPTDLIPELQGRFPIRVELHSLGEEDLRRVLTEPRSALVGQYRDLLATDGVSLSFTDDAVAEMARFAARVNDTTENIGARRLATILETVLDEVSFEAGGTSPFTVTIDAAYVRRRLEPLVKSQDLSRFIL